MIDLINADCRNVLEDIVTSVDNPVIVTDPPFNIGYHYRSYKDRMDGDEYLNMIGWMMGLCPSVIVHYPEALHVISISISAAPERVVSWVYPSNPRRQHRDIAFYGITPDFSRVRQPYRNMNDKRVRALYARTGGAKLYDWFEVNQVKNVSKEKTAHPCQMPVKVMENVVGVLPDGVTVIDPFMGSGTTGVACRNLGVGFVGVEMDAAYFDIAQKRIKE